MRQFCRASENFFSDLKLTATSRQSLRKFFGEVSFHKKALNAALLQQTATSTSLCCSGDLSAVHHHVGANRICEAVAGSDAALPRKFSRVGAARRPCQHRALTNSV